MSAKPEVISQLKTLIATDLDANISEAEIGDDMPLFEGGIGLDSVNLIELISLVEKRFEVRFSDEELNPECFSNMDVLANMVIEKQQSLAA